MNRPVFLSVCLLTASFPAWAQQSAPANLSGPIPLEKRMESYAIYANLLPNGEMAARQWPHAMWFVRDLTVSPVPGDEPCRPAPGSEGGMMNPHEYIHPTADREQDFKEILEDFDQHCHDHLMLQPDIWHSETPVRLLTPEEQREAQETQFGTRGDADLGAKYKGASAIFGFSEVYFNAHHTVALVFLTDWCGNLCGHLSWLALALEDGKWKPLPWQMPFGIS
jgi:hypothetical protein